MSEPKREYGWRMLKIGEMLQCGDEVFLDYRGWHKISACGHKLDTSLPTRRRIAPGEGWEIIPPNETLPAEFEGFNKETQQWQEDGFTGTPRPTAERCFLASRRYLAFRRRIASDWVKCSERLPEANRAFWAWRQDLGFMCFVEGVPNPKTFDVPAHWRYCEGSYQIPPAPIPEQSAAEKAWEEFAQTHRAFKAGFEKGAQSK